MRTKNGKKRSGRKKCLDMRYFLLYYNITESTHAAEIAALNPYL